MYDTLIIGSGPAGLTAAIYSGRAKLSYAVIEKEYMGTGQIAVTEQVDNYPGLAGIDGYSLGEKFREHAESFGAEFIENDVTEIIPKDKHYVVRLADGSELETKTVIYAAGAAPRRLDIAGESELSGRGVSYCAVCDGAFYEGKVTAVIGGGDTALEDALYLSKIASKVLLVHRRDEFRGNKTLQEKVRDTDNIELVLNSIPYEIIGEGAVKAIKIIQDGSERIIDTDGVFVAVGTIPSSGLLKNIAELDDRGYVVADETGKTSAAGIFAAGDVRKKALRQVVTAASDGANCVYSAEAYLSQNSW